MGRPIKWRRVDRMPSIREFVPSDEADSTIAENTLLIEEYEAIRLKDLAGLEQEACAEQMQISRPTFQRILMNARQKVADSLINGKGIRIAGGNVTRNVCLVRCLDCGHEWRESIEVLARERLAYSCPICHANRIVCAEREPQGNGRGGQNRFCLRGCWRENWNDQLSIEESERELHADDHDPD